MAVLALVACQRDVPTEPTRLAPNKPELALTGGVGTPIFPVSFDGEPQPVGFAIGLNDAGQVTGSEFGMVSTDDEGKPFRWSVATGLVKLVGCCESETGNDINSAGTVVGVAETDAMTGLRGFVATGTTMTPLPILPGADADGNAAALAINDVGQIVGVSFAPGRVNHAVLWSPSLVIQDLGTLGGSNSQAIDINGAGQVIGTSQISGNAAWHAFLWSAGGGMQDLTAVIDPGVTSVVEINGSGQIIGTYTSPSGQSHAFIYTPGSGRQDLGTLGGSTSEPTGLNDAGNVVGKSTLADGSTHAFLWTPADGMEDLTALSGITDVRRLNANLQTLYGAVAPSHYPTPISPNLHPRLVQLQVTQSNVPPTALFTVECNGLTCVLDGRGSLDDKPGLTYAWNLDKYPGGTATGATVTVTYPHASQRTVTLTVTDANGLTSTRSETFDVATSPIAAFTVNCTGLTCTFDASASTASLGPSFAWEWRFGDGSTSFKVAAPTHTYAQPGTYAVRLEIVEYPIGEHSGHAILTKYVTVGTTANQPPVASFTYSCSSLTCAFNGTGSTDDHGIVSYAWNLDKVPGGSASGATVTTTYPHTGPRHVTLTVTDAAGQTSTMMRQLDVGGTGDASPVASFTWTCTALACSFDASASTDDNGIVSYAWNLDKVPGGSASGVQVTTTYPHSGPRNVTLTVTDTKGQTSSLRRTLLIP